MEMKTVMVGIISILVAAILLANLLPTATDSLYSVKTADSNQGVGLDGNGKTITDDLNVTNDGTVIAIWNLFPLFAVLGGMAVLTGYVYKQYY